jgi:hypothetical protein
MSFKRFFQCGLLILLLGSGLLISCGPSPEEIAATEVALTAAAVTDTPMPTPTSTPTPTPTPIPYDLTILITGEEDAPIEGATVVLTELGEESGTQITDDTGLASWQDLPGETVSLTISAQGYFPSEASEVIDRGANQLTISLERDPFGLLPAMACGPDEQLLYINDIQDGVLSDWPSIDSKAFGWDIVPNPDEPENMVILQSGGSEAFASLEGFAFDDIVWRIQFITNAAPWISFNMRMALEPYETEEGTVEDSRYVFTMEDLSYINREEQPIRGSWVAGNPYIPKKDVWHQVEISTYEGELEVWVDGYRILAYTDPNPLPDGGIFFEVKPEDGQTIYYLDNIVVCGLSAPYVPMPTPESQ